MITIEPAELRSLARGEEKAYRIQRGGAYNAILDVVDGQALDGQAIKFDVPFPYKGDLVMLKTGCFGDTVSSRVGFWIDHEKASEVASTDDALELMIDDDGLQFRLDLGRCKHGPIVARMCATDNRSAISVGSDIHNEHRETIAGESVRVVTRATLKEITICKDGAAGINAFGYIVDKRFTPKPVAGHRSATFKAARMLHGVSRVVRSLKAQAVSTYGRLPRPRRSVTLDQLNRMQTAEIEHLQAVARGRHGLFL